MEKPKLEKAGVLWINKDSKGEEKINLVIDKVKYVAFKNNYKIRDIDQDFNIYLSREIKETKK